MRKFAPLACALTLLLAACSQPPVTPAAHQNEMVEAPASPEATLAAVQALQAQALPTPDGATSVRADGTLLVGGQPMFPMGFYHVSWAGTREQRLRDLNTIADMGFNFMNATLIGSWEDLPTYRSFLDQAAARGVKVMVEDFDDHIINTLKDHRALLGWMIADDCHNLFTPEQLLQRHQRTKALDPAHLTYTSMAINFKDTHTEYFGKSDIVGDQAYPVGGGDEVGFIYPIMKQLVRESQLHGTMPVANLQSFRWEGGRYPTATELRSMTNQALAAGVKGLLYYAYLDRTNNLASQPGLRAELKNLAAEVRLLSPVLLEGQRQELPVSGTGGVEAAATLWKYNGRQYVQVLNLSETRRQTLRVTLPGTARTLTPLFAGRPSGMKVQGNAVTGALPALSVHWYEVN